MISTLLLVYLWKVFKAKGMFERITAHALFFSNFLFVAFARLILIWMCWLILGDSILHLCAGIFTLFHSSCILECCYLLFIILDIKLYCRFSFFICTWILGLAWISLSIFFWHGIWDVYNLCLVSSKYDGCWKNSLTIFFISIFGYYWK